MPAHISDKKAQRLLTLNYIEKQMRKESKYIKLLKPEFEKAIKKVRHLEQTIIIHDKILKAWTAKQQSILAEIASDQQATGQ